MLAAIQSKLEKLRSDAPARVSLTLGDAQADAMRRWGGWRRSIFSPSSGAAIPRRGRTSPSTSRSSRTPSGGSKFRSKRMPRARPARGSRRPAPSVSITSSCSGWAAVRWRPTPCAKTFGPDPGLSGVTCARPTDTQQIAALDAQLDIARSLFIVASKSGTTTEPDAFFRYFYQRVNRRSAVRTRRRTSSPSPTRARKLEAEARETGFLRVFVNDPNIGGRYSALSYFGMVQRRWPVTT